ncbi:hypothetical protein V2K05_18470 [Pseudomonas alliivorans]|nr:hypothetical protein [Pseudomonas alliivorans]MEE4963590.1 hypothetical protein [Pseudomonas alliivorans]MEE4973979.1 hypothetical protein [Pseudomonas alliivorans]MEE4978733.1 hypothetical protein [Pseudomonas alliivorans]MEE4983999.1 hypothetical protein [Pseudomonas alliivorans]
MNIKKFPLIYLDSCDYSNLSKPGLDRLDARHLAALRAIKNRGGAVFVFSGAHISEMSPMDQQYASAASERTRLMVELCGRNTMISFDRLIKAELTRLVMQDTQPVTALNVDGEWFPDMGTLMSPIDELDVAGALQEQMDEHGMNRKMRRILKSGMTNKHGRFRSDIEQRCGQRLDYSELLERTPMRPRDMTVLKRYLIGKATREEADKAFLESLRDPSYMAQWFIHHHQKLGAVGDWVRRPARELIESCEQTLSSLRVQLKALPESERAAVMAGVSGQSWGKLKTQGVIDIVNRLLVRFLPGTPGCDDISKIEQFCPGIFVCINAFYDSLQKSFGEQPRAMKASDFVDVIHALYVPYVSYFRADKHMCGVLQLLAQRFGTQVVASPAKLTSALGVAF